MSDILIRGMKMPKKCGGCLFCLWSDNCKCYQCVYWGYNHDDCLDVDIHQLSIACPFVNVPPHGRLIDADALVNDCEKYIKSLNPDRDGKEIAKIRWLVGVLNGQQTIIEADREINNE